MGSASSTANSEPIRTNPAVRAGNRRPRRLAADEGRRNNPYGKPVTFHESSVPSDNNNINGTTEDNSAPDDGNRLTIVYLYAFSVCERL